jgi:hypothetical protein
MVVVVVELARITLKVVVEVGAIRSVAVPVMVVMEVAR